MGLYDEQIRQRKRNDEKGFEDSFASLAAVIMGKGAAARMLDERERATSAIGEILKYYHVQAEELPANVKGVEEQLEYLLRPSGIMRRTVRLEDGWHRDCIGPMLGFLKDGSPVALLPKGHGYRYVDWETGSTVHVNATTAKNLEREAICFYRPLPLKELTLADLARYIASTLSATDIALVLIATGVATVLGMISPAITQLLYGTIVPNGVSTALFSVFVLLIGVTISTTLIGIVRSLVLDRISARYSVAVEAAAMARVLSLPAPFFKEYSSGNLASRISTLQALCSSLSSMVLTTGLTSVFSLAYIAQIFAFAPSLVVPALGVTIANLALMTASTLVRVSYTRRQLNASAKNSGVVFSLFTGIQKIRLSGSERRAFSHWAAGYSEQASYQYNPPLIARVGGALTASITLAGTLVIYWVAATTGVSLADYMAFNTSYGMVSGALMQLASMGLTVAQVKPMLEMVEPILEAKPEVSEGKRVITRLTGSIELSNVSFRYQEEGPDILKNLTLRIRPGQYVAIVGKTGCGKSTLMRLMLGFEQPQKGAVYFDGKDVATMDLRSLRRNIGVVMQDGKLFQGDIYSNIVISAPHLSVDDAWEAAEMAGVADDIRAMPMGMHTLLTEGGGGISGGQRQRLMIARAIAPKPRVLLFDEATSALDNVTQRIVSDSLETLRCTRVVIAHRLSTIRHCDRILVLDEGRIAADGTYEELLETSPLFAELVDRQRLDK